jgi:hypothetical protein
MLAYEHIGISKVRVRPKRLIGAPTGTHQVAYGMVGHLISKVRVHPKRLIGAPTGTHQVAYGMVGHLISELPEGLFGTILSVSNRPSGHLERSVSELLEDYPASLI